MLSVTLERNCRLRVAIIAACCLRYIPATVTDDDQLSQHLSALCKSAAAMPQVPSKSCKKHLCNSEVFMRIASQIQQPVSVPPSVILAATAHCVRGRVGEVALGPRVQGLKGLGLRTLIP